MSDESKQSIELFDGFKTLGNIRLIGLPPLSSFNFKNCSIDIIDLSGKTHNYNNNSLEILEDMIILQNLNLKI